MKNVVLFVWRYYLFFLFLILETFAIYLIAQNSHYHNAEFINSANRVSAAVYKTYDDAMAYLNLKKVNQKLSEENAELRSRSEVAFFKYSKDTVAIKDTVYRQQYSFIAARVINNSTNKRNNYLTLNRGKLQGVEPDMAVIANNSVVGIVKDVSENYASVLSLLHKSSRISAKLKKSQYFGSLIWNGEDPKFANVLDIPSHVQLHVGDTVITSAYSAIFPEGVLIGTIEKFELKPGENFYFISVRLSTNFHNLSYVQVVRNMMKEEQQSLEGKSQND